MSRWMFIACLVACGAIVANEPAQAGHGRHHRCMNCAQKRCELKVSRETEEVDCYEVECEDVCIPPVTFPWECRPSHCGRIRTVAQLTTDTVERQVCVYEWDVVEICPRCCDAMRAAGCEPAPGVRILDDAPEPVPMADPAGSEGELESEGEAETVGWGAPWAPTPPAPVASAARRLGDPRSRL